MCSIFSSLVFSFADYQKLGLLWQFFNVFGKPKLNFPLVLEGGVRMCLSIFTFTTSSRIFSLYLNKEPLTSPRKIKTISPFVSFFIHSPTKYLKDCNYSNATTAKSPTLIPRVRRNVLWFMIHNKVLNFHDWILFYHELFHDKIKDKNQWNYQ